AYIYPTTAVNVNDVYLDDGKTLKIAGSLNSTIGDKVATVTLKEWKRGKTFLSSDSDLTDALVGKFALTDDDLGWDRKIAANKKSATITSPIYVVDANDPDNTTVTSPPTPIRTRPEGFNKGTTENPTGTKTSPYASIAAALACEDLAKVDNTITIAGTLDAQALSASDSIYGDATSITITGYKPDTNPSAASIDAKGTADTSALKLEKSGITVTINNLLVTGGNAANGGGINIAKGTVKLADGAVITGNAASGDGGGVYVAGSDSALFVCGKALIGDSSAANATRATNSASNRANTAKNGGGIYNNGGAVYIGCDTSGAASEGYALVANSTDGYYGVRRNFSTSSGAGGGIYHAGGTLKIASGDISLNNAGAALAGTCNGGGIYCADDATISGGSFTNNYASNGGCIYIVNGKKVTVNGAAVFTKNQSWVNGGAVYNAGEFTMTAGTIGGSDSSDANKATGSEGLASYGGAIYQGGTFNVSGSAFVYPGSEKTNDVFLVKDKYVMLGATSLSAYTGTDKMTITPAVWKRGTTFLGGTDVAGNYSKFACSDSDWSVVQSGSFGAFDTGATIYVSETAISGVTNGKTGNDSTGRGTQKYPYATIQKAAKETWKAQAYTISVNGTLTATSSPNSTTGVGSLQEIPNDSTNVKATSITLTGTNSATINGGSQGSALTISKAIPVTITNLTITGGSGTSMTVSGSAQVNGGGINLSAGTLKLADGAKVYGNYAANYGGGVYVASGATLFMYGSALIGYDTTTNSVPTSAALGTSSGKAANYAQQGGGIYSKGSVYLGYTGLNSGTPVVATGTNKLTGGVRQNYASFSANGNGGGIYNDSATFQMANGNISYNAATGYGGAINGSGTLAGGTIEGNKAAKDGGGVYFNSGTLTVSGATFTKNSSTGGNGGAICNAALTTIYLSGSSEIANNTAVDGGAIYAASTSYCYIKGAVSI
ncbi:MAG: hypothetical protein IK094_06115, partial [Treponema sp.]|nr:hypothetical protein [Treponema sp.]